MFNDLEGPVLRRHPQVSEAKQGLLEAGALGAIMCGSGPTVAGLVPPGAGRPPQGAIEVSSVDSGPAVPSLAPRDSNADLRDQNPASLPLD